MKTFLLLLMMMISCKGEDVPDKGGYTSSLQAVESALENLMPKADRRCDLFEAAAREAEELFKNTEEGKDAAQAARSLALRSLMRIEGLRIIASTVTMLREESENGRPLGRDERKLVERCYETIIDIEVEVKDTRALEKALSFEASTINEGNQEAIATMVEECRKTVKMWDMTYPVISSYLSDLVDE